MADTLGDVASMRPDKLDRDYPTWSITFRAYLRTKGLWETLDNPVPPNEAEDATAYTDWKGKDERALAQIILGVKTHHLVTVSVCTRAREAWDALEASFSAQTNARRAQLTVELTTIRKKAGESIHVYANRAKAMQAELATAGQPMDDNTTLLYVLRGLGAEYKMIKTVLLAAPQFLAWESVTTALLPVEAELGEAVAQDEGVTTAAYQAGYLDRAERRRRVTCWKCGKKGHYKAECRLSNKQEDGTGHSGGSPVVFMATGKAKTTVCLADDKEGKEAGAATLMATPMDKHVNDAVVFIDSGATHHMAKKEASFVTYHKTDNMEVEMANGDTVPAVGCGSVVLFTTVGAQLVLEDTLHVPSISANLLSVRVITKKKGKVVFEDDTMQLFKGSRLVATGVAKNGGQYVLEINPVVPAYASVAYGKQVEPGYLWHRRLSHLGAGNLAKMPNLVTGMDMKPTDATPVEGGMCIP